MMQLRPTTGLHLRRTDFSRVSAFLFATGVSGLLGLTACGGGGGGAPAPTAEAKCGGFLNKEFEGAKITQIEFLAATPTLSEHCRMVGEMPKDLKFELRVPTQWNGRIVFFGGGGFDGYFHNPEDGKPTSTNGSPNALPRGYATITTNHGHTDSSALNAEFALDPELLTDYAYRAVPRVLVPAKALLKANYGDAAVNAAKIVYEGCSGGGRQGLIQVQRHPDLFDGVISRAPANAYTPQFLWYQKILKQMAKPGAALSAAKADAIGKAVLAKCDALDGLTDGVVGKPAACQFDPAELKCTGAETDSCLTDPQIESARAMYASTSVAGDRYKWPSFPPGGETSATFPPAVNKLLGEGYIKYMVAQNAAADPLLLDPGQYTTRIDQLVTLIDATNPDIKPFRDRGGKLMMWAGLTDWVITSNNATDYYNKVVAASGGQAEADKFVEYFTAPGVNHCAGGAGADRVDLLGPMFDWIERGVKPSSTGIVATRLATATTAAVNRPLCRYPQYPKYNGSGDPNAASSFICTSP